MWAISSDKAGENTRTQNDLVDMNLVESSCAAQGLGRRGRWKGGKGGELEGGGGARRGRGKASDGGRGGGGGT